MHELTRLSAGAILLLLAACARAEAPPNIVLFLVDDMGWQNSSVPFHVERTLANDHFRTPNMERLAAQGVKFTQAYSAAVCSPSRTAILTGQNPARHRVTNWTLHADRDQSGRTATLGAPRRWRTEGLQPWDVTLPRLLQRSGYRTIHGGKAHWGAYDTLGADPTHLGFDVNIAGHAAGGPGHYHGTRNYGNKEKGGHTRPWGVPGLEKYHGTGTHLTDAVTVEALSAVTSAVEADQPFFLYLAHYAVHAPLQEHRPFIDNYRGQNYPGTEIPIPEAEARYASMVEGMDASLGAVMARLEELGVAEDTIVVFTSDNGGLSAHARGESPRATGRDTHNWPLREGKGSAYEGGTRVPFLAAWVKPDPANAHQQSMPIAAASTCETPILCEDLFPTLVHWAGAKIPPTHGLDGHDLTGLITAVEDAAPADRALLFHYPHVWGPKGKGYQPPHSAIRLGNWKAIYFYQSKIWELYDLASDLGETQDRSTTDAHRLRTLAARLRGEFDALGAQYPVNLETGVAEPVEAPQPEPNLLIDGSGPGWETWTLKSFVNVNCSEDTWTEVDGVIHATGNPVGVIRSSESLKNLELTVEWRHLRPAGNSGVFLWASPESIENLEQGKGRLPHGIEVQVLDLGYRKFYEERYKKPSDWFTSHGDVFPTGPARMKPFPPVAPNGKRSFPTRNLTRDVGEWNHYYIRAIDGEVRLWVNGEEVSGGTACHPAEGFLCLESEGSPVEFRNLRVRTLP